ncbi:MAG: potassium transporter TrkG [Candidatus Methylacidiphilales bacterium]
MGEHSFRMQRITLEERTRTLAVMDGLMLGACLVAVVSLIIYHGFELSSAWREFIRVVDFCVLGFFVVQWATRWFLASDRLSWFRHHRILLVLSGIILVLLALAAGLIPFRVVQSLTGAASEDAVQAVYIGLCQGMLLLGSIYHFSRRTFVLAQMRVQPTRVAVGSFLFMILVGWGLLSLPKATYAPIDPMDALFIATSAVCVTGLVSVDVATTFTPTGQFFIALLIQAGGLGIMTLTVGLFVLFGGVMGFREQVLVQDFVQADGVQKVTRILLNIVLLTVVAEVVGFLVLFAAWEEILPDRWERAGVAAFHAISAFCNAGFSNAPGGFESPAFTGNALGLWMIFFLATVSAAGYPVLANLVGLDQGAGRKGWRIHTKLVVGIHVGLIVVAALVIWALEFNRGWAADKTWWLTATHSTFVSTMPRTAGFGIVDLNTFGAVTVGLIMILMVIGGAPGGTAGGIKLTTVAVVYAYLRSLVVGNGTPRLLGREIDSEVCLKAMAIVLLYGMFAVLGTVALLATEDFEIAPTSFEVISAMSTCGLSLGITPDLSPAGKGIVIFLMFAGRLGILTLLWSLLFRGREPGYQLPRENVMLY